MSEETKPEIPQKSPYSVELEVGTYWWCSCGKSAKQPFCDGSHKGTGFAPQKLEVEATKTYYLCGCKHSANTPFCDGGHKHL
jgi:CDGSH iron-sulfur domain-containing protein 3